MSRRQRIVASSPCWEALTIHDGPIEYGDLTLPGCFCWRNTPCPWWQPMWHQNKRSNTLLLKHGFLLEGWFSRKDWWAHSYTQEDLSIDPLIRLKTTTRRINHTKSNTFHQGFVWVVLNSMGKELVPQESRFQLRKNLRPQIWYNQTGRSGRDWIEDANMYGF